MTNDQKLQLRTIERILKRYANKQTDPVARDELLLASDWVSDLHNGKSSRVDSEDCPECGALMSEQYAEIRSSHVEINYYCGQCGDDYQIQTFYSGRKKTLKFTDPDSNKKRRVL